MPIKVRSPSPLRNYTEGKDSGETQGANVGEVLPDPVTPLNLPYDATGAILPNRVRPSQAGFGAVNAYQTSRNVQGYIRFSF